MTDLSTAQLLKLQADGAELHFETQTMRFEQIGELISALKRMADDNKERVAADSGRHQSILEIVQTLQTLVRKSGERGVNGSPQRVDTKIVEQLLEQIKDSFCMTRPLIGYDFEFRKDQRGFTHGIRATPFIVADPETRKY